MAIGGALKISSGNAPNVPRSSQRPPSFVVTAVGSLEKVVSKAGVLPGEWASTRNDYPDIFHTGLSMIINDYHLIPDIFQTCVGLSRVMDPFF